MGELDVIVLTTEINGSAVIDERAGRRAARSLGLDVIGTLGLLEYGIKQAWLDDADGLACVEMLRRNGFRCPPLGGARSLAEYLAHLTER